MITILVSRSDNSLRRGTPESLADDLAHTSRNEQVIWVDLENPTREEEDYVLAQVFGFHPLAIRDCQYEREPYHLDADHHPKVEDYGAYLFSIINPIDLSGATEEAGGAILEISTRQINVFLGASFIVTHHYEPSKAIDDAKLACEKNPLLFTRGPDYIYHLILDDIVHQYSPLLDRFDDEVERLERDVFRARPGQRTLAQILALKRVILRMRRITAYQREMVYRLSRGEFELVTSEEIAYYRNVYDHLERAADLAESYREVLTGLIDAYLSVSSHRLNEVVKVLTILSTFFLPLTFIAGVYGMNFRIMPELEWKYGYVFAWLIMAGTALTMYIIFRRKKWL